MAVFVLASTSAHDAGSAARPRRGISRPANGTEGRAQFCANPRFRPAPTRPDVKTFRPPLRCRCAGADAGAGRCRRCVHAVAANMHASAQSAYFKWFLFNACVVVAAGNARAWCIVGRRGRSVATVQATPRMARM
ncbi:putative ABC transporter protein [Stenotrophomonas maltophilia K279a]|uniref:ABC transporter protein n=1 Tax=Stenotrophomonas maltophilia (strain K279a) TaxID=522373 RepID=B2FR19_STRMK|nr:putative ABC transporter protein [Stenotrophomonas maltophilia K279a]